MGEPSLLQKLAQQYAKRYFVYILRTARGHFYTGVTTDVTRRLEQHNGERKGGAKCLRGQRPCALVWVEEEHTKSSALKRERQLKKLGHKEKQRFVDGDLKIAREV